MSGNNVLAQALAATIAVADSVPVDRGVYVPRTSSVVFAAACGCTTELSIPAAILKLAQQMLNAHPPAGGGMH